MRPWQQMAGVAVLGAVLGALGARFVLVGSAWSLLPWGVVAVLVGALTPTWRRAVATSACYGFALAFSFMVVGYDGSDPVAGRLPAFVGLGLVGAVCAVCLGLAGFSASSRAVRESLR